MQTTDATFEQDVLHVEGTVLVDFWASWCPPCKMMQPMIMRLRDEYRDRTPLLEINIDRNQNTAQHFRVTSVPTFILFDRGKELARKSGALTENQLRQLLDQPYGERCVA